MFLPSTGYGSYGQSNGTIWIDDVWCRGSEEGLSQCLHSGWGVHNCHHYEDASVICDSKLYGITVCSVVDMGECVMYTPYVITMQRLDLFLACFLPFIVASYRGGLAKLAGRGKPLKLHLYPLCLVRVKFESILNASL